MTDCWSHNTSVLMLINDEYKFSFKMSSTDQLQHRNNHHICQYITGAIIILLQTVTMETPVTVRIHCGKTVTMETLLTIRMHYGGKRNHGNTCDYQNKSIWEKIIQ